MESSHPPESFYRFWAAPQTWPSWDRDVAEVRFSDDMIIGAEGWMRPASGPATTFTVTALQPGRLLTTSSRLPGARLIFEHQLAPAADGALVTVIIGVDGPLRRLWRWILGRSFVDAAERSVRGLVDALDSEGVAS